jgi:cyanate permease
MRRSAGYDGKWIGMGLIVASLVILVAALWMPWATYRSHDVTRVFRAGRLDVILVLCGALALVLGALTLVTSRATVYWGLLATSCVAVVCSIGLALTQIKDANDAARGQTSGLTQTSFGIGAVLGTVAGVLLLVLCAVQLTSMKTKRARLAQG